jgi:two-component system NtrC family sensor kinase
LNRPDRFRIFRGPDGNRVLGIINPIENQPSCSNAACHAHRADQKILGVLDTQLSLALTDQDIEESTMQMFGYTIFAVAAICVITGLFVVRFVHRPLRKLESGTHRIAAGDLGHQIEVESQDEIGELAVSFNTMSEELREAREENAAWTRELEKRVEQKTKEVQRAQEHVMQVEKMASVGKLAAVVAHEINNPLAGILTYTKLLKKWLSSAPLEESRREEVGSSLDLIETESRRCGEIVRNLLMFSRSAPMNLDWTDLNDVIDRCAMLVRHQAELSAIELRLELEPELTSVFCDPAQIEQALLALVMNAMDAMFNGTPSHGGTLWMRSRSINHSVELDVEDDGPGIPADILPQIFEPFFTTKEKGHSVGLGLAVCRGIIERHGGRIHVKSEPGRGTRFTISLPLEHPAPKPKPSAPIPQTATKAR